MKDSHDIHYRLRAQELLKKDVVETNLNFNRVKKSPTSKKKVEISFKAHNKNPFANKQINI